MKAKTLHLTLKKKWFDMTLSKVKPEEYREIKKYWIKRLVGNLWKDEKDFLTWLENPPEDVTFQHVVNHFDTITCKNGYSKNAPEFTIKHLRIEIREGNPEWGAIPGKKYFVLKHGEILSTKNIKQ